MSDDKNCLLEIFVAGKPAQQGSKKAIPVRKGGRVVPGAFNMVEDSSRTKPWRAAIAGVLHDWYGTQQGSRWTIGSREPVAVMLLFRLPRPKDHYGTGRNAKQLKASAPPCHATQPDIDKLARAALDGLVDGAAFADDAQVCALTLGKVYAQPGELPGMEATVWPVLEAQGPYPPLETGEPAHG